MLLFRFRTFSLNEILFWKKFGLFSNFWFLQMRIENPKITSHNHLICQQARCSHTTFHCDHLGNHNCNFKHAWTCTKDFTFPFWVLQSSVEKINRILKDPTIASYQKIFVKKSSDSRSRKCQWFLPCFEDLKTKFFGQLSEYQARLEVDTTFHTVIGSLSGPLMRPHFVRAYDVKKTATRFS